MVGYRNQPERCLFEVQFARNRARVASERLDLKLAQLPGADGVRFFNQRTADQATANQTMFIFGTGPSINELTPANWSFVHSQQSIGINYFSLHSFIPNFYFFEPARDRSLRNAWHGLESTIGAPLDTRILLYSPGRRYTQDWESVMGSLHFSLKESVELYVGHYPLARNQKSLEREYSFLLSKTYYANNRFAVVDPSFTVGRALWFAINQRFKRVVLVGIDLNSANYFYQDSMYKLKAPQITSGRIPWGKEGNVHKTESAEKRVSASAGIKALVQGAKIVSETEVLVSSRSSKLSEFLPVFDWSGS